ncbi:hypothetical protein Geob_0654 [Geotalea daltonii FRC-32]|uniref:Uncharacterized protein n=1 Tax=Geotalea daltonii (strain DSM 22248 / JCM 15807 / FRC-32) TaxID=316067 RepID=B9M0I2_GEODF|nr:hypothetical protein [Geotalea daltonii]ACM19019.1 hypothetical protein Geob_0654 [Geotalea daltonii FRC-32]
MRYDLITILWGPGYTGYFLEIVLPSHLAKGNLEAFRGKNSRYRIFTTSKDAEIIRGAAPYQALSSMMTTEIFPIDFLDAFEKYKRMTLCHKIAIKEAEEIGATMLFLPPDVIFATGAFANLLSVAEEAMAIMIAVPRVVKDAVTPLCLAAKDTPVELNIQPRHMVQMMLSHLHPTANALFYDTRQASIWPSQIYFKVPEQGLIAHCFHLHPILVRPRVNSVAFDVTIDGDYLLASCPDSSEIAVITDSDLVMAMEPCDDSYGPSPSSSSYQLDKITEWAATNANQHHRHFFTRKICFHSGETNSPEWLKMKEASEMFVSYITAWLGRSGSGR